MGRRHGFTLVEITVALGLTLILAGATYRLLRVVQRLSRAQAAHLGLQSNVRTAALVAANELRGLNSVSGGTPAQNDILSLAANAVSYRASRGNGFLCQPPAGAELQIARNGFSGYRDPQPVRDMAYVFLEGNPDTAADDSWLAVPITAVSSASACAGGAGPAISLSTASAGWSPDIITGTPVRIYEIMELKAYQSDGQWWLGARSVGAGEVVQPIAGPLAGRDGFHLEFLNRNGAATADPSAVAAIRVTVRGVSEELGVLDSAPPPEEELITGVALRNGPRP
jgi:prepilin-type N-terminal cleavage/methylation domain-containing protein